MGRVGESRIGFEQLIRRLSGSREQLYIVSQVGDGKLGQTMLALPEEVAGPRSLRSCSATSKPLLVRHMVRSRI